jgi:CRP/FNR family transcriptional regulator
MQTATITRQTRPPQAAHVAPVAPPTLPRSLGLCRHEHCSLSALRGESRALARGEPLFRFGDELVSLYNVHAGQFKTSIESPGRPSQISEFHLTDEVLGLDGIGTGRHTLTAVALEDAWVEVLPYDDLSDRLLRSRALRQQLWRLLGREMARDQTLALLLCSATALARVAAFVLDLSSRLQDRGFSPTSLVLRMTRAEIGSYLGLQLETVSRSFSRLRDDGVIDIRQRHVQVRDASALRRVAREIS